jgi:single-strand DNA-binding protein
MGESINQYLTKGKLVAVEGAMRQDRWEQDGQTRSKTLISANSVQLLGSAGGSGGQGGYERPQASGAPQSGPASGGQAPKNGGSPGAPSSDDFTDDIPF